MNAAKIVLYTSKTLSNKLHPIYIRINVNKKVHYLPIYPKDNRFNASTQQWDSNNEKLISNIKINPEHKNLNAILSKRKNKLITILQETVDSNKPITIDCIRTKFFSTLESYNISDYIQEWLRNEKSYGTIANLRVLSKDLSDFNNNKKTTFSQIDYDFVEEFIRYQKFRQRKNTTIAIRLRYLRKILNHAINDSVGSKDSYPFSHKYGALKIIQIAKYEKEERKIAVKKDSVDILINTPCENKENEIARRIFITSYAARGMNFKDMAKIKYSNIYTANGSTYLTYNRNKTAALINLKISPLLQKQINWFKNNTELLDNHILPIIRDKKIDTYEQYIHNKLNNFNYRLTRVAKELNIDLGEMKLSSYSARHSFATNLYHKGVSVNVISQALSHKSISTTAAYLQKFSEDEISSEIENIIG